MFTLADAVLFRPLSIPAPERLVQLRNVDVASAAAVDRMLSLKPE